MKPTEKSALDILQTTFGYDEFRPLQQEVIDAVLAKRDALVIMPTGGGKSLCYQVPALMFSGLTIVVSPLISLMKDQVQQLTALGVRAAVLNSSLDYDTYRFNIDAVYEGRAKLLYLAPETLLKENVQSLLSKVKVDCIAIDEAHCISQWGHDFRPEYRALADMRSEFPDATYIALTATATPRVQTDIKRSLNFNNPAEFVGSFDRKNLFLEITAKQNALAQIVNFLNERPNNSGIIYCFSRKQVNELADDLVSNGFNAKPYHAGLSPDERMRNQEAFIRDDVSIIVATIAFGMGIDKPNVRFVIHHDLPKNVEGYYQEIGRAGRDSLPAHCLLLYSRGDIGKLSYFIRQKPQNEQRIAYSHLDALTDYADSYDCRRISLLAYFGENFKPDTCGMCDNCTNDDRKPIDLTLPAQKFLSCVKRADERFGTNHIIDILRGSENEKVRQNNHQDLSTYGIGKEYTKEQWQGLATQFSQQSLMSKDEKWGTLTLTPKAYEVFRKDITVMGYLPAAKRERTRRKSVSSEIAYNHQLFDLLRQTRKRIADDNNVPPYVIFPDQTLMEMAAYYPQSAQSLHTLHGVGEVKLRNFGDVFLDVIKPFCAEHGLQEKHKESAPKKSVNSVVSQHAKFMVIGRAYNAGKSIKELMQIHGVKSNTIAQHLEKFAVNDNQLRVDETIPKLAEVHEDALDQVFAEFDRLSPERLRPIYDALGQELTYDQLHLLRVYYRAVRGQAE